MASIVTYLLSGLGVYWFAVFWQRWTLHSRTQQFILEQRRKAGIPDSDKRPLAVASIDAAKRRQKAFEDQLQRSEDVFGRTKSLPQPSLREPTKSKVPSRAPLPVSNKESIRSKSQGTKSPGEIKTSSAKRGRSESDLDAAKRTRTDNVAQVPTSALADPKRSKRQQSDAHIDVAANNPRRKARRLSPEVDQNTSEDDRESMSEDSQPYDSESIESMDEEDELVAGTDSSKKRAVDTSDDHQPGDEWLDANGLRWRIGQDGVPRRLVTLVEMRPKYRMPKDAKHSDTKMKVASYVERFLSQAEYEEAKRRKLLSWQHELALANNSEASSPLASLSDETVDDSLASLVSRRAKAGPRRNGDILLYNDVKRRPNKPARSLTSAMDDSFNTSFSDRSDDSRSFSASISGKGLDSGVTISPRRIALTRSPANAALRAPRFSHVNASPSSPLSSSASTLDAGTKRRREQQLLNSLHDKQQVQNTQKSDARSKVSTANIPTPSTAAASDEDSAALGRFFYRNRMVQQWGNSPARRTTLRQLVLFGQSAQRHRSLLMESANYLRTEVTTRIAHRLRDMQALPFVAMSNEQLDSIYQFFWSTFERLRRMERIESVEQNQQLIEIMTRLLSERKSKLALIAGISRECVHYMEPETVDLFLARMLRSQVSREVLAKQHIALTAMHESGDKFKGTRIGMIDTRLDVAHSARNSTDLARQSVASLYGWDNDDPRIPKVEIHGDMDLYIAYVTEHLDFILLELIKVAIQSTMSQFSNKETGEMSRDPAPVTITIVDGPAKDDMMIRVSDRGGGLHTDEPDFERQEQEYSVTRARGPILLPQSDKMQRDPEKGLLWSFMNIGEQLDRMNIELDQAGESESAQGYHREPEDPSASYPGGDGLMRLSVLNMESKNGLPMYVIISHSVKLYADLFGGGLEFRTLDG
ncbi:putative protein kinase [Malassezia psittaci]|uniref:Protein-serine/threonine kinase n=1 Tax=Malassezia psittaci TaxID=1821823 RepID=A0AAF0F2U8_9BASI|nr:putative protein kinase [Malassezia psittaci]